jgi:hypothetical protein
MQDVRRADRTRIGREIERERERSGGDREGEGGRRGHTA